jgi:putative endonuclease
MDRVKRYWVYMLQCADGSYYIGVTSNVEQRIGQHDVGWNQSCYTHDRRPLKLVYAAEFAHFDDAMRCEKKIKGWSRKKKAALVRNDWDAIKALSKSGPSTSSG